MISKEEETGFLMSTAVLGHLKDKQKIYASAVDAMRRMGREMDRHLIELLEISTVFVKKEIDSIHSISMLTGRKEADIIDPISRLLVHLTIQSGEDPLAQWMPKS